MRPIGLKLIFLSVLSIGDSCGVMEAINIAPIRVFGGDFLHFNKIRRIR